MAARTPLAAVLCGALLVAVMALAAAGAAAEAGTDVVSSYVVHVAQAHAPPPPPRRRHGGVYATRGYSSFLRGCIPADLSSPAPTVLYAYSRAATGFAARLTGRQAAHLASVSGVLAVVPDVMSELHTTLTPSFLGLEAASGLLPASGGGTDVVIGVIDTGVYPLDRASFAADPSLPPPPRKFRGGCVSTPSFNGSAYCNGKLVGAKFFYKGMEAELGHPINETVEAKSPLDTNGHGTHTASTAAGSAVSGASFYNYGRGKAVGVVPGARIAVYKVCWGGCSNIDILAAFDEAIADKVDVISVSLGAVGNAPEFHLDTTAVGAFRAVRNGIVVSASAGNSGPGESTAVNVAPWIITVGASTINRRFVADVILGSGDVFTGTTLYAGEPLGAAKIELVDGGDAGSNVCEAGKLNASMVAGKIVLCAPGVNGQAQKGLAVKLAGGAGAIISGSKAWGDQVLPTPHIFPATAVTFADAGKIRTYMKTNVFPVATIVFRGTVVGSTPSSPRMASFSGRGPNLRAPEILKPDVTAPGVDILAAWTGAVSPTGLGVDQRRVHFNIISGTSMSCPHVSGVAGLLRQARPEWSPAAIKSALMTTAYNDDSDGDTIRDMATGQASTPFARWAGHVDPNRAADPGLVYDAGTDDYTTFLCALGYTADQVAVFTGDGPAANCSTRVATVGNHNYPAFAAVFTSDKLEVITQRRAVRNVGDDPTVTYVASVSSPAGVRVTVTPPTLRFSAKEETLEYEVTFAPLASGGSAAASRHTFGSIVWSDGEHTVRSPVAVTWPPAGLVAEA